MQNTNKKDFKRKLLPGFLALSMVLSSWNVVHAEEIQTPTEPPEEVIESEKNLIKTREYKTVKSLILYEKDDTMYPDEERVLQEGQHGRILVTTITNSVTGEVQVIEETIKEKIDTIILKGTKPYPVKEAPDNSAEVEALRKETEALKKQIESLETKLKNGSSASSQSSEISRLQSQIQSLQQQASQQRSATSSTSNQSLSGVQSTLNSISSKLDSLSNQRETVVIQQPSQPVTTQPNQVTQPQQSQPTPTNNTTTQQPVRRPNQTSPRVPTNTTTNVNVNENDLGDSDMGLLDGQGSVEYNLSNANQPFPVYRGNENESFSADARQFLTFATKNGNTFHLIVNHDQDNENVLMLAPVSEADLLALTDGEVPEEVVEEEPIFTPVEQEVVIEEPVKEKSNIGMYLMLFGVIAAAMFVAMKLKKSKTDEEAVLAELEESDEEYDAEYYPDEEIIQDDEYFTAEELEEADLTEDEEIPVEIIKPKQAFNPMNSNKGYVVEESPEESEE